MHKELNTKFLKLLEVKRYFKNALKRRRGQTPSKNIKTCCNKKYQYQLQLTVPDRCRHCARSKAIHDTSSPEQFINDDINKVSV